MKFLTLFIIINFSYTLFGNHYLNQQSLNLERKYLIKSQVVEDKIGRGQQILIRQPPHNSLEDSFIAVDDRTIMDRLGFTQRMKIDVLRELLTFQFDTVKSNKLYYIRGKWRNVAEKEFTIEIEALYSFTRMLCNGNPRILPVLINRKTKEEVTFRRKEIDEIFTIYRKWLAGNEKRGFKSFEFPLTDSSYDWQGGEEDSNKYLKKSL